jgi:hypothetical protein
VLLLLLLLLLLVEACREGCGLIHVIFILLWL